jgi:polyvinyl alcohol dehydrogenase (cytochrome)
MKYNNPSLIIKRLNLCLLYAGLMTLPYSSLAGDVGWPYSGQNSDNTHFQNSEQRIGPNNVANLFKLWEYDTDNNNITINKVFPKSSVIATPSVDKENKIIYFGDINGRIHAVSTQSGKPIFIKSIVYDYLTDDINESGANINNVRVFTRQTPLIYKDLIVFGLRDAAIYNPNNPLFGASVQNWLSVPNVDTAKINYGGLIIAVDRFTGKMRWKVRASDNVLVSLSGSMSERNGIAYGGVSGNLEETSAPPELDGGFDKQFINQAFEAVGAPLPPGGYTCCNFVGSVFALNLNTGKFIWRQPMIDPSLPQGFGGYSGGSVWGSAPVIDPKRKSIYVATSGLYNAPISLSNCLTAAGMDSAARAACLPEGIHSDSVVSLDMDTGKIKWSRSYGSPDIFSVYCAASALYNLIGMTREQALAYCPDPSIVDGGLGMFFARFSTDVDVNFGMAPMLIQDKNMSLLVTGRKSGETFALNPDNGQPIWQVKDGVGGATGGHQYGLASDGKLIYAQEANSSNIPSQLPGESSPSIGGYFDALNIKNGATVWATRDPATKSSNPVTAAHSSTYGPLTIANGVVYGTSISHSLYALDAKSGSVLWSKTDLEGSGFAAPAIYKGVLYWPTGYATGNPTQVSPINGDGFSAYDNKVYAFTVR